MPVEIRVGPPVVIIKQVAKAIFDAAGFFVSTGCRSCSLG